VIIDQKLFDADFLDRLRSLFFKLRKRRQLRTKGAQSSPVSGFTREFKDHRHYSPGDDYRSIDWRLYARLEKTFVRVFEEVQEFHVHILLDRSRSMIEPYPEKAVAGLQLAAALAYLALINGHRVSLMTVADGVRRELPPLKGQGHIHELLAKASTLEFEGVSDLDGALGGFRPSRDRRGIVFLLSDLLGDEPDRTESILKRMVMWPAETHVIHVLHPQEMRPDLEGEIRLIDVETDELRRVRLTKRELERYAQEFAAWIENLRGACLRNRLDYLTWTTDRAFEELFVQLLSQGSALAGK
jgi:uncharacterized protein (DUF58 family)